jgi:hypothetical protein
MIVYKYSDQTTNYLDGIRKWFPTKSLPANITEDVLSYLGVVAEDVPDPVPTLDELKEAKCAEIRSLSDSYVAQIREGYTAGEVETFAQQYSGAKFILGNGGNMEDSLFVSGLLSNRLGHIPNQAELNTFALRIVSNYESARDAIVQIVGTQQRLELAARNASTKEEVEAIGWQMH